MYSRQMGCIVPQVSSGSGTRTRLRVIQKPHMNLPNQGLLLEPDLGQEHADECLVAGLQRMSLRTASIIPRTVLELHCKTALLDYP